MPSPSRRVGVALGVVSAVVAAAWWLWPAITSLTGGDPPGAVLLVDDGFLSAHERAVGDRFREDGRVVEWLEAADWCAAADNLIDRGTRSSAAADRDVVIISLGALGACDDALFGALNAASAVGARDVVIVPQHGIQDDGVDDALADLLTAGASRLDVRLTVADTTRLLGEPGTREMPCEWWEACDGVVQVRLANGLLSTAGAGRVSRLIVELLR
ncbi:MAG: hypothetical protein RJB61_886 [Actinomycetota bacterium]|jgi:hypothetical protein